LEELKYQLLLARDLMYINENNYNELLKLSQDVGRLLNGLIVSLEKKKC
jgi:four helix bundle protein